MKIKITLLVILLTSFIASAQIKVTNRKGEVVKDGYSAIYKDCGADDNPEPEWYMKLKVKNTSKETVFFRVVCEDIINNDGKGFNVCAGILCADNVIKNRPHPFPEDDAVKLDPSEDHAVSLVNRRTPSDKVLKWVFRIQLYDGPEHDRAKPIGKPIKFTYIYDKNLSINKHQLQNVSIYPTAVNSTLTINTKEDLQVSIYDLAGKEVVSKTITEGEQKLDVSNLQEQVYITKLENNNGQSLTKKIIKQ